MRAAYGSVMRGYFLANGYINTLIDFGDSPIFENATTYTCIVLWNKEKNDNKPIVYDLSDVYQYDTDVKELMKRQGRGEVLFSEDNFVIADSEQAAIKRRIEEVGVPLHKWDIKINRGILTGLNEAFIIDSAKKDELIAADPKSADIIKPILRGRDIKRYRIESSDSWLIATHNGYKNDKSGVIPPINVEKDYPIVYKYLLDIGNKIEEGKIKVKGKGLFKRDDQGVHWSNLRDCAYYSEFEKNKIMYAEIVYDSAFYFDTSRVYPEATTFVITGDSIKYLTACLNSKLLTIVFRKFYAGGDLRGDTFRYKKEFLNHLPVPDISKELQLPFEIFIDYIQFLYEVDKNDLGIYFEKMIDAMVYELYFSEEIKKVKGEVLCYLNDLPVMKKGWSTKKKSEIIETVYEELSNEKHPISIAIERQKKVKEVRIIEGLES